MTPQTITKANSVNAPAGSASVIENALIRPYSKPGGGPMPLMTLDESNPGRFAAFAEVPVNVILA